MRYETGFPDGAERTVQPLLTADHLPRPDQEAIGNLWGQGRPFSCKEQELK